MYLCLQLRMRTCVGVYLFTQVHGMVITVDG